MKEKVFMYNVKLEFESCLYLTGDINMKNKKTVIISNYNTLSFLVIIWDNKSKLLC